jgi:hypothetical protein
MLIERVSLRSLISLRLLKLLLLQGALAIAVCLAQVRQSHAQAVSGCENPPIDEPDNDGDECYVPPDQSQSMGDPNNPDSNSIPNQPGQSGGT